MIPADAVHLVDSDSASGHVKQVVRARIVRCGEQLTSGPCHLDPREHRRARRAWYEGTFGEAPDDADLAAAVAGAPAVVLWATDDWRDRPWLWWALFTLARIGSDAELWRVSPPGDGSGVAGSLPAAGSRPLDAAARVGPVAVEEGRTLWTAYCDPSPLALDAARRDGRVPEDWGGWFPRWDAGKLRLSPLDEILLSGPAAAFGPTGAYANWDGPYRVITGPFGGVGLIARLVAWAEAGALDRERGPEGESPWTDRFRANDRTAALLGDGLASTRDMPPIDVGGCRIGGGSPWVRVGDGAGWRVAAQNR